MTPATRTYSRLNHLLTQNKDSEDECPGSGTSTEGEADVDGLDSFDHLADPGGVDEPDVVGASAQGLDGEVDQLPQVLDFEGDEGLGLVGLVDFQEGAAADLRRPGHVAGDGDQARREANPNVLLCVDAQYVAVPHHGHSDVVPGILLGGVDVDAVEGRLHLQPVGPQRRHARVGVQGTGRRAQVGQGEAGRVGLQLSEGGAQVLLAEAGRAADSGSQQGQENEAAGGAVHGRVVVLLQYLNINI